MNGAKHLPTEQRGDPVMAADAPAAPCPLCHETRTQRIFKRFRFGREWSLTRCSVCGLHFTEPPPTPEDLFVFYGGSYHLGLREAGGTEGAFGEKYRSYIQFIRGQVPPGSSTLDIGCATGLFPKMLQELGYRSEGVEFNADSAKWGQEHFHVSIHQGTLDTLLERGRTFDFISMTDVLEHTVSPPDEVRKVRRLLNRGGHFMVTFPDILSASSRYLRVLSSWARREWIWETCHIPLHTWEFTYPTAVRLFTENGFSLVQFRRSQAFWFEFSKLGLLSLPVNIAALPGLRAFAGSQMELLLRKDSDRER
jgi:SAM-dependent methyltransferase